MGYLLVIVVLGLLILIHELGHLAAAKYAKIPIERFSVGFGPRLWGFNKNGTDYWLSLVPLGGYVLPRIDEDEGLSEFPLFKRIVFCLGGPMANILTAFICVSIANAANSGINLSSVVTKPLLQVFGMAHQIISAIPVLFHHPDKLSGIVGIVALGGHEAGMDISRLLTFSVFLSVNLGVFNMLPIPPLDGGKIVFSVLESIYKPLKRLQIPVAIGGWVLMLALMLYATIIDVQRLVMTTTV
jgi:regulator of sigma E protease